MINLKGIDLGGSEAPVEGGEGGGAPTPALPSAGKPFVARTDFSFDKRTHVVTLQARVAGPGEIKSENVVGDKDYFPIEGIPTALKGVIHRYNMNNKSGQELLLDFGGEGGTLVINKQMVSRTTKGTYFAGVNADLYSLAATFDGDDLKASGKFSVKYKASGKDAKMIATADTKWTRTREDYILVEQSFEVLPE